LYRWALPGDVSGLIDLIDRLDQAAALVVTSANQVRNLFAVAADNGRQQALEAGLRQLQLAAIGPVAARSLEERGLEVAVQPAHPSMGALVRDLASFFARSS
ncbi:MAG: uroporphyrinogen-III synthase, partial [Chloroflexota bacterium]|nr:uroporphyrinogen-III synthase [Chloroflexota bacterium]